jgi:hypothetical protein
MKQDKPIPFNPNDSRHLKTLEKWTKKMAKKYKKEPLKYFVVDAKLFRKLKYHIYFNESLLKKGYIKK